jgi:hypothetical protein
VDQDGNKAEWKYDPDGRPGIWVSEGIDLALQRRGYPSIEGLKAGKNGSSTKVATFRC